MIYDTVQAFYTFGYFVSPLIMVRVNRRPQFITNLSASCLSLLSLAMFSFIGDSPSFLEFIPILSLFVMAFSYGFGVGPVGFNLVSEIFPQELRSLGCSLSLASRPLFAFLDVKMISPLVNWLGLGGAYLLHSGLVLIGIVFAWICLPETRNKTFSELENLFQTKHVERGTKKDNTH